MQSAQSAIHDFPLALLNQLAKNSLNGHRFHLEALGAPAQYGIQSHHAQRFGLHGTGKSPARKPAVASMVSITRHLEAAYRDMWHAWRNT